MFQERAPSCGAQKRFRFVITILKIYIFRGVAQLVARQFRVLEAWSSNLHTSTKKKKRALVVLFFFLAGVFDSTPFALCAKEFAFQTKPSESLFSSGKCRNIAHRAKPPRFESPCGCLFLFRLVWVKKPPENYLRRLIVYLAISALM